ncbi:electron transport complex subunit RsxC [Methylomagnum sp.]
MTLWNFHGGLRLEPHKAESTQFPPRLAPLPERLILPLQKRDGRNAEPQVKPGDRVLKGQIIAGGGDNPFNPPIHASTSGTVLAIEPRPLPHPSGLSDLCLVIGPDGEDAAVEFEPPLDHRDCEPAELLRRIHRAGIVGLGGAGFPTAVKADTGARRIDTLILNGAECEPYITCDDTLLRQRAGEVLRGADILRHILRAERCLVAIENDRPDAIAAATLARQALGLDSIEIVPVPAIYPTGGEKQLIRVLTGLEVPARGIPADIGVVCQNVGTTAAVYRAVARGEPLLSRLVTVTGRGIRQPQNLDVRLGTPIAELAEFCGGYTDAAERLILGGPMMGFALASDAPPVVKSTNCVLVAGRGELGAAQQPQPCIRCGACAEVCPANLLPQQLYWYSRSDQLDRALDYRLADCIECGCCDVVCPSHIPLVQYFRATKGKVHARQRERDSADQARVRFEARQARKVEETRERAEAAKRKKANLEKAAKPEIKLAIERAKQKRAEKHSSETGHPADTETVKLSHD